MGTVLYIKGYLSNVCSSANRFIMWLLIGMKLLFENAAFITRIIATKESRIHFHVIVDNLRYVIIS
jgi:hypothetical protein